MIVINNKYYGLRGSGMGSNNVMIDLSILIAFLYK